MLDVKWIREHREAVQLAADAKKIDISVAELLLWDDRRRELLKQAEDLRRRKNESTKIIAESSRSGERLKESVDDSKMQVRRWNVALKESEKALDKAQRKFDQLMGLIPNVPSPDTPPGDSDADNVELRKLPGTPNVCWSCWSFRTGLWRSVPGTCRRKLTSNMIGKLEYCHTLNNTAVASPRILIPLLENHQREDGSIHIPQALRKYMAGMDILKPNL